MTYIKKWIVLVVYDIYLQIGNGFTAQRKSVAQGFQKMSGVKSLTNQNIFSICSLLVRSFFHSSFTLFCFLHVNMGRHFWCKQLTRFFTVFMICFSFFNIPYSLSNCWWVNSMILKPSEYAPLWLIWFTLITVIVSTIIARRLYVLLWEEK